jgi:putative glutamine amidotransferase
MTRPLIGITTDIGAAAWGDRIREVALSPAVYSRAIERAGGAPVLLPPVLAGAASRLVAGLDGLMFCGGADIGARWYGLGADGPAGLADNARDSFEIALLRAAVEAEVPFLAISRGMQVLNVALGGTLTSPLASSGAASAVAEGVQSADQKAEPAGQWVGPAGRKARAAGPEAGVAGPEAGAAGQGAGPAGQEMRLSAGEGWLAGCAVRISPDSRLGRVLGATAAVPARRHQALDRLGRGLIAVAWASDESVAAVEVAGHPFGIGVRWHPEEDDDIRIFTELRVAAEGSRQPAPAGVS